MRNVLAWVIPGNLEMTGRLLLAATLVLLAAGCAPKPEQGDPCPWDREYTYDELAVCDWDTIIVCDPGQDVYRRIPCDGYLGCWTCGKNDICSEGTAQCDQEPREGAPCTSRADATCLDDRYLLKCDRETGTWAKIDCSPRPCENPGGDIRADCW